SPTATIVVPSSASLSRRAATYTPRQKCHCRRRCCHPGGCRRPSINPLSAMLRLADCWLGVLLLSPRGTFRPTESLPANKPCPPANAANGWRQTRVCHNHAAVVPNLVRSAREEWYGHPDGYL